MNWVAGKGRRGMNGWVCREEVGGSVVFWRRFVGGELAVDEKSGNFAV